MIMNSVNSIVKRRKWYVVLLKQKLQFRLLIVRNAPPKDFTVREQYENSTNNTGGTKQ